MTTKKSKRFVRLFLSLLVFAVMVVELLPTSVLAEGTTAINDFSQKGTSATLGTAKTDDGSAIKYATSTSSEDENIKVTKAAEWTSDFKANITVSVSGKDGFSSEKKPSDVVLVVDNSNSMYTPECYNPNHIIYLPYSDENIKDGVFAEKQTEKASIFFDGDVMDDTKWKIDVIPTLVDEIKAQMGEFWSIFEDELVNLGPEKFVDTYSAIIPNTFTVDVSDSIFYIALTVGHSEKIASDPANWLMFSMFDDSLAEFGNISKGIFYGDIITSETTSALSGNGIIDVDMWNNSIHNVIKNSFSPDMIIDVPGKTDLKLIYVGKVNPADTSYAANQANADDMTNWKLIDISEEHTADLTKIDGFFTDFDVMSDWTSYVAKYHFENESGLKRVGSVQADGYFARNPYDAENDSCILNATIVKDNVSDLATLLLKPQSGNRVSVVYFEDTVYKQLGFTDSLNDVNSFLDDACSGPSTDSTYNTNYEAAWDATAKQLDTAKEDSAKFVVFLTDGWPTVAGVGDDIYVQQDQDVDHLTALVNGAGGLKAKYDAVVSTISIGVDRSKYDLYVSPLATDPSLQFDLDSDETVAEELTKTMQSIYQQIYVWAENVVLTDYISPNYSVNTAELSATYPDAKVFNETINGVIYEKVVMPIGDIVGENTATIVIPVTLKEQYRDIEGENYYPTNADSVGGLTTTYTDPDDSQKHPSLNTDTPYLPSPNNTEKGNLTVKKTVSGSGAEIDKDFTFTIQLNDTSINGKYGDMTFEGGVATITLKAGEDKTATDIDADIEYTVTETDNDGYIVTATGATGKIAANTTAVAAFNNHKDAQVVTDTITLTLQKIWNDNYDVNRPASISVQLYKNGVAYGSPVVLNYSIGWKYAWSELDASATWTVDEVSVPEHYKKSVTHNGNDWTITNDFDPSSVNSLKPNTIKPNQTMPTAPRATTKPAEASRPVSTESPSVLTKPESTTKPTTTVKPTTTKPTTTTPTTTTRPSNVTTTNKIVTSGTNAPHTGDNSKTGLYMVLMLCSFFGMLTVGYYVKKQRNEKNKK